MNAFGSGPGRGRHRRRTLPRTHGKEPSLGGLRKDLLAYIPTRALPAVTGLFVLPVIASLLGPYQFGIYSLAVVTVTYCIAIFCDVIVFGYQREAHTARTDHESVAATSVLVTTSIGSGLLLLAGGLFVRPEMLMAAFILVPAALLRVRLTTLQMSGNSVGYSKMAAITTLAKAVLGLGLAAILLSAWGPSIGWGLASLLALPLVRKSGSWARIRMVVVRPWLHLGIAMVAAGTGLNLMASADRFIVNHLLGLNATGQYSFGYTIAESSLLVFGTIPYIALYPILVRMWDAGEQKAVISLLADAVLVEIGILNALIALGSFILGAALRAGVMATYHAGAVLIPTIAGAILLLLVAQLSLLQQTFDRRRSFLIKAALSTAALNIALTIFLVGLKGISGAAIATMATYLTFAIIAILGLRRPGLRSLPLLMATLLPIVTGIAGTWYVSDSSAVGIGILLLAAATSLVVLMRSGRRLWTHIR